MDPFHRNPNQPFYPEQDFQPDINRAKQAAGYKEHARDLWTRFAEGKTLGKQTIIAYQGPTLGPRVHGPEGNKSLWEILRIHPRGDAGEPIACQVCLTLAAPQVLPGITLANLPKDPSQAQGGFQDNIMLAGTIANVGGSPVQNGGSATLDWVFANPIAVVQWGTGSINNRVEADMMNGLCLNLQASWLTVSGFVETGALGTSGAYLVGANVGPGSAKPNNAQRTVNVGYVANGALSSVFAVPRFAKRFTLIAGDGGLAGSPNTPPNLMSAYVSFWQSQGGIADGFPAGDIFVSGNNGESYPVPNGAYYFSVLGNYAAANGVNNPNYSAIFELSV